jgi:hypothetical protein
MKIDNFSLERWGWETFITAVVILFIIIIVIGGTISILHELSKPIEVDETNQPTSRNDEREFDLNGFIAGEWVTFPDKDGGGLYVCRNLFGEVYEIEIRADGSRRLSANFHDFKQEISRSAEGDIGGIGLFLSLSPADFENICDLGSLPTEVQKEVFQILYSRDLVKM